MRCRLSASDQRLDERPSRTVAFVEQRDRRTPSRLLCAVVTKLAANISAENIFNEPLQRLDVGRRWSRPPAGTIIGALSTQPKEGRYTCRIARLRWRRRAPEDQFEKNVRHRVQIVGSGEEREHVDGRTRASLHRMRDLLWLQPTRSRREAEVNCFYSEPSIEHPLVIGRKD